jgi:hypothetical protein
MPISEGWLKFHTAMIYQVSTHNSTVSAIPNRLWQNLLTFKLISEKKADASTKSTKLWETTQ